MQRIPVRAPSGNYLVCCGRGICARVGPLVEGLGDADRIFLLSSPRVWARWGQTVAKSFRGAAPEILFDDRESSKNLGTVERICRALAKAGADRRTLLVAIGGGVVGDVAGFVAASYQRGVGLVHVPTTLLAQIDSAIGGKTGVNLPEGKNLVGAFYQPQLVVSDPETLRTLSARQYRAGLYEAIKYGVLGDAGLFRFVEHRMPELLRRDSTAVGRVVARCVRIKAEIVRRDERERGLRESLNLGHTIGHALEAATNYRRFLHGEAVGWGMLGATLISVGLGRLDEREAGRIARLIARVGPLPPLRGISPGRLLRIMRRDKKSRASRIGWVMPRGIGRVELQVAVPEALVAKALRELPRLYEQARERP
jgi:3-dehydroquinate synthase